MTIITNAPDRKKLVNEISEHLGIPAVYLRTPSYAYQIGSITVNHNASISADDPEALKGIRSLLIEKGYIEAEAAEAISDPAEEQPAEEQTETEVMNISIGFPFDDKPVTALRNLIFILYSKQTLLNHAIGEGELLISDAVIEKLKNELPGDATAFGELVNAFRDSEDIRGIECRQGNIHISYGVVDDMDGYNTFLHLTHKVFEAASQAKRVFPEHQRPESEKYVMRSWLVRLGMAGPEYKGIRRCLLKKLTGHSAFPNEAAAQKHRDRYAQIRREQRENKVNTHEEIQDEI